jgi:hypothetical protein
MKHLWFHKLFNTAAYKNKINEEQQAASAKLVANAQEREARRRRITDQIAKDNAGRSRMVQDYPVQRRTVTEQSPDPYMPTHQGWPYPDFRTPVPQAEPFEGKGGTFDGAGASSDWDRSPAPSAVSEAPSSSSSSTDSGSSSSSSNPD